MNITTLKDAVQQVLAKPAVATALTKANRVSSQAIATNRFTATAFTLATPLGFNRERYAQLAGRAAYYRNLDGGAANDPRLRRNIHRLEKALIMEPRRDTFALNYIGDTVASYEAAVGRARAGEPVDHGEITWATDVLRAYFEAVKADEMLTALRDRFEALADEPAPRDPQDRKRADQTDRDPHAPFERGESPTSTVTYDELLQLAHRRRSVRWFEQTPVDRELIDKALMVARQSPSACNRQPFEYRIFDDPELAKKIAGIPFGTAGYSQNVPAVAVLVGRMDNYFSARDRHVIYIDAALSAMAFMFALETLGLASSPINWPDFEPLEMKMAAELGLEPYERPVMLIAIGHPRDTGGVPYSAKKSLDSLRSYNPLPES